MTNKPENLKCPDCNGPMTPRSSSFGKFWGCKRFPSCKGTRDSNGMSKREKAEERFRETGEAQFFEENGITNIIEPQSYSFNKDKH